MLLVGMWKYGLGSWEAIQKDKDLKLSDKFFLDVTKKGKDEEKSAEGAKRSKLSRTPSAVHLVRRSEYLLKLLREIDSTIRATRRTAKQESSELSELEEVAEPPLKKQKMNKSKAKAGSSKKSKESKKDSKTDLKKETMQPIATSSKANGTSSSKKRDTPVLSESDDGSSYSSMDEDQCKGLLRPVKHQLKELKTVTDTMRREEKVEILRKCLAAVGKRIDQCVKEAQVSGAVKEKLRIHLWVFTTFFWLV